MTSSGVFTTMKVQDDAVRLLCPRMRLGKTPRSRPHFFNITITFHSIALKVIIYAFQAKMSASWICYEREREMLHSPTRTSHHLKVGESLVVKDALRHDAREGQHGRPTVRDLLELHALDFRGALAVKETLTEAEVPRRASGSLEHLGHADPARHLGEGDPNEDVPEGAVLDGRTVGGGARGRCHRLRITRDACAEVDGDVPEPSELAHASVLELGLAEVIDGEVVRYTEGVEADVSDVSLAVRGGREEGEGLRFGAQARRGPAWGWG
jgi:hypothetical protein